MTYEIGLAFADIILGISFTIAAIGILCIVIAIRMHSEERRRLALWLGVVVIFLGIALYVKTMFSDYHPSAADRNKEMIERIQKKIISKIGTKEESEDEEFK